MCPRLATPHFDTSQFGRVYKLTTTVDSLEKPKEGTKPAKFQQYAVCASINHPGEYLVQLMHPEHLNTLGQMATKDEFRKTFSASCYSRMTLEKNKAGEPEDIYVDRMASPGGNRGKALHEAAFRMSMSLGAAGEVKLGASWSSHVAHYKAGFRSTNPAENQKIESLIKQAKPGEQVDSNSITTISMQFPKDTIDKKIAEFKIAPADINSVYFLIPKENPKGEDKKSDQLKFILDDKASARDLATKVKDGLLIEIDASQNINAPADQESIINMARLKSVVKAPWDVSYNFYEEQNWERAKKMANNAIKFAVDNLDKYAYEDIQKLRSAGQDFLSTTINSDQDIAKAFYGLVNTLIISQKPLSGFMNSDYKNMFLNDIQSTLNDALGTTLKPSTGFMSGNKPIHELSTYAEALKTRLMINETVAPALKK